MNIPKLTRSVSKLDELLKELREKQNMQFKAEWDGGDLYIMTADYSETDIFTMTCPYEEAEEFCSTRNIPLTAIAAGGNH